MRSRAISWMLLGGIALFGTGAVSSSTTSEPAPKPLTAQTAGIREAREMQYAADLMDSTNQPLESYLYYWRTAAAFPHTPHGRYAKHRLKKADAVLAEPAESPGEETPRDWLRELWDFLVWP